MPRHLAHTPSEREKTAKKKKKEKCHLHDKTQRKRRGSTSLKTKTWRKKTESDTKKSLSGIRKLTAKRCWANQGDANRPSTFAIGNSKAASKKMRGDRAARHAEDTSTSDLT